MENTGFKFESRIFYFIDLQNEEDYEDGFFFMPFGDIRSMRPSPSIPSMGKIQCIINRAVMRINEQNYEL